MGLFRKKDKRSTSSRNDGVMMATNERGDTGERHHQNTRRYESKEAENDDSALTPFYGEPYSPTATDNSSSLPTIWAPDVAYTSDLSDSS